MEKILGESAEQVPTTRDETEPSGKWAFDSAVTAAFDDMLRRSIPQYEIMRQLCFDLGCPHVEPGTSIVDLGCSRGEALAPFVNRYGAGVHHVGVEVSEPMLAVARERFSGYIKCGVVDIRSEDLRVSYPPVRASLTLCILTLQFIPIEYRQRVLLDIFHSTVAGGALILVEKVLGSSEPVDKLLRDRYWALKKEQGYTQDQIDRKRLALEGVLVPVTAAWNEQLVLSAGFRKVECFWRFLNFAGWIAIKD
jgi:tRNA (cmo5U34)-methyltransferase